MLVYTTTHYFLSTDTRRPCYTMHHADVQLTPVSTKPFMSGGTVLSSALRGPVNQHIQAEVKKVYRPRIVSNANSRPFCALDAFYNTSTITCSHTWSLGPARVVNGHSSQCGSSFLLINHTSRSTRCMTVTKESVVLMQSGMSTYLVLFTSRRRSKLLFAVHF